MDLLKEINECKESELEEMIENLIFEMNEKATKVDKLGFLDSYNSITVFKGFIPFNTRIKYSNLGMEDYSMNTTDFFYEFAEYVKKNKIKTKLELIKAIEYYVINYFGYPSNKTNREEIFEDRAWNSTTTDEEYFEALKKNSIGDLKGMGAAECTEYSALAQQLLSLFGTETYYLIGKIIHNDKEENHAFNAIKRKDDYAIIDYSIPCPIYNDKEEIIGYVPFIGILSNEEFKEFIQNKETKEFNEFYFANDKYVQIYTTRNYQVSSGKSLKRKANLD